MGLSSFDFLMLAGIAVFAIGILRSNTLIKHMHDKNMRERQRDNRIDKHLVL